MTERPAGDRVAYLDCFSGISGDMCLGALISAGWPAERVTSLPGRLGLEGVTIEVGEARRGPFTAARVEVRVAGAQPHRHLHHVAAILDRAAIDPVVRTRAHEVFQRLARAEAEVHGSSIEKVHFHEVGAADAMVDIAGALEGVHELGIARVFSSAPRLGRGSVRSEHGVIPIPAPATTLLLRGAPIELPEIDAELVTPTGAALLMSLVEDWGAPPPFRLETVGTGAGGRDLTQHPNVLRMLIGRVAALAPLPRRRVAVLETSLDDENPQFAAASIPRLLGAGALDAMMIPTVMKKGRPGLMLVVVADLEHAHELARLLLAETSTLGVRMRIDERYELDRSAAEVETPFGRVTLKIASLPGGGRRAVPEFESVRAAAEKSGRPLREVAEAAIAAFRQSPNPQS